MSPEGGSLHPKRATSPEQPFIHVGDKKLKALQKAAWDAGWWPERKKKGIMWFAPSGAGHVMIHGSNSDHHALAKSDGRVSEGGTEGLTYDLQLPVDAYDGKTMEATMSEYRDWTITLSFSVPAGDTDGVLTEALFNAALDHAPTSAAGIVARGDTVAGKVWVVFTLVNSSRGLADEVASAMRSRLADAVLSGEGTCVVEV